VAAQALFDGVALADTSPYSPYSPYRALLRLGVRTESRLLHIEGFAQGQLSCFPMFDEVGGPYDVDIAVSL